MRYPRPLGPGDTIGVCAPSSGVKEKFHPRLDRAIRHVEEMGYRVRESASLRKDVKDTSADPATRAAEFLDLYADPQVAAIVPPWGGEFLMEILPLLDFEAIAALPPTWVCGYSDTTTLTFPLTLLCDVATVHGSNFMNLGYGRIHERDLVLFEALGLAGTTGDGPDAAPTLVQEGAPFFGGFTDWTGESESAYDLTKPSAWRSLSGEASVSFSGRMVGGCLDVLCKLAGTRFAPVEGFLGRYRDDGFVWTLESCEMKAADIHRTLWQLRECGWFRGCRGVLLGRPDGYADTRDFTLDDALHRTFDPLGVPVLCGADIGHVPPQMQVVNGAWGTVAYERGSAVVTQAYRA